MNCKKVLAVFAVVAMMGATNAVAGPQAAGTAKKAASIRVGINSIAATIIGVAKTRCERGFVVVNFEKDSADYVTKKGCDAAGFAVAGNGTSDNGGTGTSNYLNCAEPTTCVVCEGTYNPTTNTCSTMPVCHSCKAGVGKGKDNMTGAQ